ncbi:MULTISPECIES: hypothetical protein [Spiroplasma]|uniref:hypothetical protein n=1 Tax=Spiroplasma TaxID=2132 RepID=UPI002079986D|nr:MULTISPECIES: hypothetical protein [Spiroplasma]WJG70446.1 hypothetical protein SIXOD_v1c16060 [Spiroplasma ixodetis Y32]
MAYVYLIKYQVNYTDETKYKVFSTFKDANNFHRNYKHHLLENAFITHYEILVMELDMEYTNQKLN